jgi:hypothetical protein
MSTGFEFADLVDEAVERSGGETATATDILKIRRGLRILTERWTSRGYNTWRIEKLTLLANGIAPSLSLPEDVDDVIQVNVIKTGLTEKPLRRISPVEYAQLTSKGTQGQPSMFYLDRKQKPELALFPIGTPTQMETVVVYYVQRPAEFDHYTVSDDVPNRWLEALVTGLALDLARKRPPYNEQLIQRLKMEADEAEDNAQRADRGRQRYRYRTSYGR